MGTIAKFIAGLLGGISTWGITAAADGGFDAVELFGLLGVVGTAITVYLVPNKPYHNPPHGGG